MFPSVCQNEHAEIDMAGSEGLAGMKVGANTPVPQVVEELVEVFTHFSQDRVQQRFADLMFQTLAISPFVAVCTPSSSR